MPRVSDESRAVLAAAIILTVAEGARTPNAIAAGLATAIENGVLAVTTTPLHLDKGPEVVIAEGPNAPTFELRTQGDTTPP